MGPFVSGLAPAPCVLVPRRPVPGGRRRWGAELPVHAPGGRDHRSHDIGRCKEEVIDHTHKIVGAFTSTALRELVILGDWDPGQLEPCIDEIDPITVSIAQGGNTVVLSFREDITAEELDAKLAGEPSSTELRDRVVREVDLSAPIWFLAQPDAGLLPLGMISVSGGIELWERLGVEASATFDDEATAAKGKTLAESYANILSSVPDFPSPPEINVTREGNTVRVRGSMEVPDFSMANEGKINLSFGGKIEVPEMEDDG